MKPISHSEFKNGEQTMVEYPAVKILYFTIDEIVPADAMDIAEEDDIVDAVMSAIDPNHAWGSVEISKSNISVGIHHPELVDGARERIIAFAQGYFA